MDRNDAMAALYRAAVDRGDDAEAQRLEAIIEAERRPAPEIYHALPYALWYAENGFPVFALAPGSKTPLHGSRGLLDATTTLAPEHNIFNASADLNIGIATGHKHDVIDIDGEQGCTTLVAKLSDEPDYLPPIQAISATPRGVHLWVPPTGLGNRQRMLPGIDYRGKGGYVVVPPSRLYDGTEQSFLSDDVKTVYQHYRWLMPPIEG